MIIQEQALSYILDSKDSSFITANALNQEHFYNYQNEFTYIRNYMRTYNAIPDKATFSDRFPDFDFVEVHESKDFLLSELNLERNKYQFRVGVKKSMDEYNSSNFEDACVTLQQTLNDVRNNRSMSCIDIIRDKTRYESFLDKSANFSSHYLTTGFREIDTSLGGGWDRNEELTTIVARPGVGKSWFMLKCAVAAVEKGLTVGLYSGEMSAEKVAVRFDTLYGNLPNREIAHGNIEYQNQYKKYLDNLDTAITGKLLVLTPADIGDLATTDDLQAFIEREKLDILFVDQYSLLIDKEKGRTPVDKASNLSKQMKALQVLEKIPIICVSQQNRGDTETESGDLVELDVSRIAQTDRIGQDSTIVIFLQHKNGMLTVTLAKARDSSSGKRFQYSIDYNIGKFEYLDTGDGSNQETEASIEFAENFDAGAPI